MFEFGELYNRMPRYLILRNVSKPDRERQPSTDVGYNFSVDFEGINISGDFREIHGRDAEIEELAEQYGPWRGVEPEGLNFAILQAYEEAIYGGVGLEW